MSDHLGECQTCRYWVQDEGYSIWGVCVLTLTSADNQNLTGHTEHHPLSLARAFDGAETMAGLSTHESFGCIQYQGDFSETVEVVG